MEMGSQLNSLFIYGVPLFILSLNFYRRQVEIEKMLSNLASYLMGGSTTVPSANAVSAPNEVAQGRVVGHHDLSCTEDEDWLLVGSEADEGVTTAQGVPTSSRAGTAPICIERRGYSGNQLPGADEETAKRGHDDRSDCEEEDNSENWVPSTGLEESCRSVKLATSPLENLLIEHPSMSVYHHSFTEEPTSALVSSTINEEDGEEGMEIDTHKKQRCRSRSLTDTSLSGKHSKDLTTASPTVPHLRVQKVNMEDAMFGTRLPRKKEQSNRNQLDRLNKSKNIPGNHKLRRKDRQHPSKRSNANNDRKCFQRPSF